MTEEVVELRGVNYEIVTPRNQIISCVTVRCNQKSPYWNMCVNAGVLEEELKRHTVLTAVKIKNEPDLIMLGRVNSTKEIFGATEESPVKSDWACVPDAEDEPVIIPLDDIETARIVTDKKTKRKVSRFVLTNGRTMDLREDVLEGIYHKDLCRRKRQRKK